MASNPDSSKESTADEQPENMVTPSEKFDKFDDFVQVRTHIFSSKCTFELTINSFYYFFLSILHCIIGQYIPQYCWCMEIVK